MLSAAHAAEEVRGILANPLFQSLCVFLLTAIVKRAGWLPDGKQSAWFVMGVSLIIGAIDTITAGVALPACRFSLADPLASLACLGSWIKLFEQQAGVVLYSATAAYMFLRREVAGRALLGSRL